MTKTFCDACEKEIPAFKHLEFHMGKYYFAVSNCLTSNPRGDHGESFIVCSPECAKAAFGKWIDKTYVPIKTYL